MFSKKSLTHVFRNNNEIEVEKFCSIETYSTPKISGIGGLYKDNYKDFVVKEIDENGKILEIKEDDLSPPFFKEKKDKFTTFHLIKSNNDTFEAIRKISRILKVSPRLFSYSGLKDKCSISVQRVSIKGNFIQTLKNLKLKDIYVRNITPTKKSVKMGSHRGNNFTVVIRNIVQNGSLMKTIEKLFKVLNKQGFPNYFGLQRFGTFRPNSQIIGRYLLESNYKAAFREFVVSTYSTESSVARNVRENLNLDGDFEKAYQEFPKSLYYERLMIERLLKDPNDYEGAINALPEDLKNLLISAFQSFLFNKMISLRVKKGVPLFKPIKGDVISILDEENGQLTQILYKYGDQYDLHLKKAFKLNRAAIIAPIIGFNTNMDEFPLMKSLFSEIAREINFDPNVFKSEGLTQFKFKGSLRALSVKPIGLRILDFGDDDLYPKKKKIKIEFSLQKGSYATMLIREILKF